MTLFNKTTGKKIIEKVSFARTSREKARGLMFKKKPDYALVFENKKPSRLGISIHMFFVFFPIDAVFLHGNTPIHPARNT